MDPGTSRGGFAGDGGPATAARLDPVSCSGIAVDAAGALYFSDTLNRRVRRIAPDGTIATVAGSGAVNPLYDEDRGDGGPATDAIVAYPCGVAIDAAGNLFVTDTINHRVRKVDTTGTITTVAGSGDIDNWGAYSGDGGSATSARLSFPVGLAFDSAGRLHIVDTGNDVVRRIDAQGIITTVAGDHDAEEPGDGGPATDAAFQGPLGIAFDGAGNFYVTDVVTDRVRRVSPAGIITTVAGTGREESSAGDGGPAAQADLWEPIGITVDPAGDLYVTHAGPSRIRRVEVVADYAPTGSPATTTTGAPTTTTTVRATTTTTIPRATTTVAAPTTTTVAPAPASVALPTPYSVWTQPTSTPLDGIGTWIVPLNDPTARAGQVAPSYLYGHAFSFVGGAASGVVGLSTGAAGKFALLSVKGPDGRSYDAAIPFAWKAGQFYFPMVHQAQAGVWVAMVYDYSAAKWVSIGQLTLPSAWGKLAPTTITIAAWAGAAAANCDSYPRADLFVHPTIGYAAGTTATLSSSGPAGGPCPAQISTEGGGWTRYQVGAA